jgi:hypothetical protein
MTKVTITATIEEHILDRVEHAEEDWSAAEQASAWEKEVYPDHERECQQRVEQAYAVLGRAVLAEYSASYVESEPA